MSDQLVGVLVTTIVILAAIPANLFLILYTVYTNWWKTSEGRFFFFFIGGLAAMIDMALIRRVTGEFPGFQVIALFVYLVIMGGLWNCLWLLVKHNHPRKEKP